MANPSAEPSDLPEPPDAAVTMAAAATPPPRRRRWLRRLGWTAAIGVVLLVVLVLLTPWLVDVVVRPRVVAAVNQRLGAPLSIGALSASWTGAFAAEDVRVGAPTDGGSPLASVARISGDVRVWALLAGRFELDADVVVVSPHLVIPLNAAGRPALDGLLLPPPGPPPNRTAPSAPAGDQDVANDGPAAVLPALLGALMVSDLQLTLLPAGGMPVTARPLTIELRAGGAGQPLVLKLANDDGTLSLSATLRPGPGGTLDPQASVEAAFHLDPAVARAFMPLFAAVPALRGLDLDVGADGTLRVDPGLAGTLDAKLAIDLRRLPLTVPGPDGAPLVVQCSPGAIAVAIRAQGDAIGAFTAAITGRAPGMTLAVTTSGTYAGPDSDAKAELKAEADLGELSRRWPGVVGTAPDALAGTVTADVAAGGRRAGGHGDGTLTVAVSGQGLAARGADGRLAALPGTPHLRAALAGDTRSGRFTLSTLSAQTSGVAVEGKAEAALSGGLPRDLATAVAALTRLDADLTAAIDLGQALAAARRVLPVLPATWQAQGQVRALVNAKADAARPYRATCDVTATDVRLAGLPGVAVVDLGRSASIVVVANSDPASGVVVFDQALVTTPAAEVDAKGTTIAGLKSGQVTAQLATALTVRPAALDAMLPGTVPAGLGGQPLRLSLVGSASADGGTLRWQMAAPRIDLAAPGRPPLTISDLSASGQATGSAGWSVLHVATPTLALKSNGDAVTVAVTSITSDLIGGIHRIVALVARLPGLVATLDGGVDLPPGAPALARFSPTTLRVEGDLAALSTSAGRWAAAFGQALPITGAGALRLALKLDGHLTGVRIDDLDLAIDGLALRGQGLESALRWPLRIGVQGALVASAWDPLGAPLSVPRLRLTAPGLDAAIAGLSLSLGEALTAVNALLSGGAATAGGERPLAGNVQITVHPAQVLALLPPARRPAGLTIADDAVATMTLVLSGSARSPQATVAARLPPVRVTATGADDRPSDLAVAASMADAGVTIDARAGTLNLDRLAVSVADLARVDGTALATLARGGGLTGLRADLRGKAELPRLIAIANALGALPAGTVITGTTLGFSITAGSDAQGIPLAMQLQAPGFAYRDAKLTLPGQDVALSVQGVLLDHGTTLRIASGALAATTAQATFAGTVRGLPGAPVADNLRVDLTYRASEVNPLLAAFGAGQLIAATDAPAQTTRLMVSGPLMPGPGVALMTWLTRVDSHDSGAGYGTFVHSGFTIAGPRLPLRLAGGRFALDHACIVNGGPTTVRITATLPSEQADVAVTTTRLALTNDIGWLLKSLNPIFSTPPNGTISGFGNCQLQATWRGPFLPSDLKPALARSLNATARVSAENVAVTGSPFLVGLVNALAEGRANDLIAIAPTDVVVKNGLITYQGMAMRIGNLTVIFSGTTDLVRETVNMTMVAPFPSAVARSNAKVAKFLPTTITVPVKGPLADPKVDWGGAITAALKSATEQALKNGLLDGAGGLIEGLLKKKK